MISCLRLDSQRRNVRDDDAMMITGGEREMDYLEMFDALSPENREKVNDLIDRLWKDARSSRPPQLDPPQTDRNNAD